jgi:hypothetical protein
MTNTTILLQTNNGESNPLVSILTISVIGVVVYFVYAEKQKKVNEAYAEYQNALQGKDKKIALTKGRYYVSLLAKKNRLLAETELQNDLHGMDDARKD